MAVSKKVALILFCLFIPGFGWAQDCTTDPASFWVCEGDTAWDTGYLIPPDLLDLRQVKVWEEKANLLPETQKQRDIFKTQRDQALEDIRLSREDYEALQLYSTGLATSYSEAMAAQNSMFTGWEVAGIAGVTGTAAVLVGLLVGGLAL